MSHIGQDVWRRCAVSSRPTIHVSPHPKKGREGEWKGGGTQSALQLPGVRYRGGPGHTQNLNSILQVQYSAWVLNTSHIGGRGTLSTPVKWPPSLMHKEMHIPVMHANPCSADPGTAWGPPQRRTPPGKGHQPHRNVPHTAPDAGGDSNTESRPRMTKAGTYHLHGPAPAH